MHNDGAQLLHGAIKNTLGTKIMQPNPDYCIQLVRLLCRRYATSTRPSGVVTGA